MSPTNPSGLLIAGQLGKIHGNWKKIGQTRISHIKSVAAILPVFFHSLFGDGFTSSSSSFSLSKSSSSSWNEVQLCVVVVLCAYSERKMKQSMSVIYSGIDSEFRLLHIAAGRSSYYETQNSCGTSYSTSRLPSLLSTSSKNIICMIISCAQQKNILKRMTFWIW